MIFDVDFHDSEHGRHSLVGEFRKGRRLSVVVPEEGIEAVPKLIMMVGM